MCTMKTLIILIGSVFVLNYNSLAQSSPSSDIAQQYFNDGLRSLTLGDSLKAYQELEQAYSNSYKDDKISYYYLMLSLHLDKEFSEAKALEWIAQTNHVIYQNRLKYFWADIIIKNKRSKKP